VRVERRRFVCGLRLILRGEASPSVLTNVPSVPNLSSDVQRRSWCACLDLNHWSQGFPKLKVRHQCDGLPSVLVRARFSTAVRRRTDFPFVLFPPRLKMIAGLGQDRGRC
jgi:hypothetical protein